MRISVAYALPGAQVWLHLEAPEGTTIHEAVELSGIRERFPDIDLAQQKVGIFGKLAKPETVLADGDRVEIYRRLTVDPVALSKAMAERGKTKPAA